MDADEDANTREHWEGKTVVNKSGVEVFSCVKGPAWWYSRQTNLCDRFMAGEGAHGVAGGGTWTVKRGRLLSLGSGRLKLWWGRGENEEKGRGRKMVRLGKDQ